MTNLDFAEWSALVSCTADYRPRGGLPAKGRVNDHHVTVLRAYGLGTEDPAALAGNDRTPGGHLSGFYYSLTDNVCYGSGELVVTVGDLLVRIGNTDARRER